MRIAQFFYLLSLPLLSGCWGAWEGEPSVSPDQLNDYLRPVYRQASTVYTVRTLPPRALHTPGRIYVKGNLLLVAESGEGIHVIDNQNSKAPKPLAFLEVPGATNLAIYSTHLYVNNHTDLVVIDLSDLQNIREIHRLKDQFEAFMEYPAELNVGFECVDATKGVVVAWEPAEMPEKIKCYR